LESLARVKFTIGVPLNQRLATEMKVLVAWVADGPAALAGQKRKDRLPLVPRNN